MKMSAAVVYANGHHVGRMPIAVYHEIVSKVGKDRRIQLAQIMNYAGSCLTIVKRLAVIGPILWSWIMLWFLTFAAESTATMLNSGAQIAAKFLGTTGWIAVIGALMAVAVEVVLKGLPGHVDAFEQEVFSRAAERFSVPRGAHVTVRVES